MLTVAALVPDTALLVPGAAGRADVLTDLRAAALEAVGRVVAARPDRVVVVAPGLVDRTLTGTVRASLAAAGVPDALLGWPVPVRDVEPVPGLPADVVPVSAAEPGVATAVALHLLARAGWTGPLGAVETARSGSTTTGWPQVGAALAGPAGSAVALVVVGSGSGRHGPDGPLADDPQAVVHDARLVADLADGGPAARARLAADDPATAAALAVSGWAPWQVLVGAVDATLSVPGAGAGPVEAELLAAGTPHGAQHLVATWTAHR